MAESIVEECDRLPRFGHPEHYPTGPRTDCFFELLEEEITGEDLALIEAIQSVAEDADEMHLLINATGAIKVVLAEMELDAIAMAALGIALVAGAASQVNYINEEIEEPITHDI